jgi:hypothetical protein
LKSGRPSGAVRYRLAVEDDPGDRQGHDRGGDRNHFSGPVPPVSAPQPDLVAVLMRDDPNAIVLELVNPLRAGRDFHRDDRLAWPNETGRLAPVPGERRTHQHGRACNLRTLQSP